MTNEVIVVEHANPNWPPGWQVSFIDVMPAKGELNRDQ